MSSKGSKKGDAHDDGHPRSGEGNVLWIDEVFFESRIEKNQRKDRVD